MKAASLVRLGQGVGLLSASVSLALVASFVWWNPYDPAGVGDGPVLVMTVQAALALLAGIACLQRRPALLAIVAGAALLPVGLYLLGTPGLYSGIGAAAIGYLLAAALLRAGRST